MKPRLETFGRTTDGTLVILMWVAAALILIVGTWQTAYEMGAEDKAQVLRPAIAEQAQLKEDALVSEAAQILEATRYANQCAEQTATIAALEQDNVDLTKRLRARWIAEQPKPKATYVRSTVKASKGWKVSQATWYGPGFYGKTMADGGRLTRTSVIVAHRSLPFGTRVMFRNPRTGQTVTATVRDRGPYTAGRMWDMGPGTAAALGMFCTGTVQYKVL